MFVDSHCHLDFPELRDELPRVLDAMRENAVTHALCIGVEMDAWPGVHALALAHPNLYASVGVHPDYADLDEPTVDSLVAHARLPKVVAIGETGLDYFRLTGDLAWQRERFRTHIRAARETGKPLVIHTRAAADDTIAIMQEERAGEAGGVMHCFTESWDVAQRALDLGFHISFSGIVTFRNAADLKDVAKRVPLDRMLIETDSPYLAPVPHRGKRNQPAWVRHVAEEIAVLRAIPVEAIARATSDNFFRLFGIEQHAH
ncbi:MAG TPA: TatD family hydrolase [Casimicrobiaceae bacterium]|nr:TatD family hydrolase [Casimicrobiaceae bacterium]